jgi:very-short-patch-repair endonuclease
MWTILKSSRLDGRKFRRQHSVGNYILDFYCPSERLAIELDGVHHYSGAGAEYDRERRLFLEQFGINVIRFENRMVFEEDEWVVGVIRSQFGWQEREGPEQRSPVSLS